MFAENEKGMSAMGLQEEAPEGRSRERERGVIEEQKLRSGGILGSQLCKGLMGESQLRFEP